MVWKQGQRCWSHDKSPVVTTLYLVGIWINKMIWNKAALWCRWFLTAQPSMGLACAECRGLISHVGNASGLPKPFPKDSHVRPVRCKFVQVVGQLFSLEVIPFWFQFSRWGSLKGDKKSTAPWRLILLWLPKHSLKETMIWTWLADCLSLDSLAPLSLGKKKKIYLVAFTSTIVMKLGCPDVSL